MNLVEKVKNAGVVGSGGAGFPTHVKLQSQVEWYIANGAECEPLMHKDRELMTLFADSIVQGLVTAAEHVGQAKPVIAIKKKNEEAIKSLKKAAKDKNVQFSLFDDYYPAGDEVELVYAITKRLIPPQGLPLDIGCVVNNVETLYNIHQATKDIPVTQTFMTITGLVKNPMSTWVPIGMRVCDVLKIAGGVTKEPVAVMESGLMMGSLIKDENQPVTKTTGGLIVLPADHNLVLRYSTSPKQMDRIGHSACDQCSYCTELCPRYLLGYDVQPHLVMRSLGFTAMGEKIWNKYALLCCRCGLCTLYSCPEALYPREACIKSIENLRKDGHGEWEGDKNIKKHLTKDFRRIPVEKLKVRLGVKEYEADANYQECNIQPEQVFIPFKQHVGVAAQPVVKKGDKVEKGQFVARVPDGQLGANIHSSIKGVVVDVGEKMLIIEA